MTLANDDGPTNAGAEALRVACRYWPADMRRRMELDALIRLAADPVRLARAKASGRKRARSWDCPGCATRNTDRGWCGICRTVRP
jgi:hypothetical protein